MKNLKGLLLAIGCVAVLALSSAKVQAQGQGGRGGFDPAQFKQMVLDRYKEEMSITNDDEWQVISGAISKVIDAEMESRTARFGGFGGGRSRRSRDGNSNSSSTSSSDSSRRRFGPEPSPEAADLQKAIDDKASTDDIKAKLAKLREANAAKEAKLDAAREDLKKLLTTRQEAIAVAGGLLK
jgi:hypothetical protein